MVDSLVLLLPDNRECKKYSITSFIIQLSNYKIDTKVTNNDTLISLYGKDITETKARGKN